MRKKYFQRFLNIRKICLLVVNKRKFKTKKKNICVVGVSQKAGVTHICLSMANFLHSVLRQKVVYVELREDSSLLSVVGHKQVKLNDNVGYEYKGVTYVLTEDVKVVLTLMNTLDAWFIIDMSNLTDETKTIFTNCNKRIVIGSLSPWCQREYLRFIDILKKKHIDISQVTSYKLNRNENKTKNKFETIYGQKTLTLPLIEDPFSLREEEFDVIMDMIR